MTLPVLIWLFEPKSLQKVILAAVVAAPIIRILSCVGCPGKPFFSFCFDALPSRYFASWGATGNCYEDSGLPGLDRRTWPPHSGNDFRVASRLCCLDTCISLARESVDANFRLQLHARILTLLTVSISPLHPFHNYWPALDSWFQFAVTLIALLFIFGLCRLSWRYFEKRLVQIGHRSKYEFDIGLEARTSSQFGA